MVVFLHSQFQEDGTDKEDKVLGCRESIRLAEQACEVLACVDGSWFARSRGSLPCSRFLDVTLRWALRDIQKTAARETTVEGSRKNLKMVKDYKRVSPCLLRVFEKTLKWRRIVVASSVHKSSKVWKFGRDKL